MTSGDAPSPVSPSATGSERTPGPSPPVRLRDYRPRPFGPAPWLPGPHAQTLGGRLLRPRRSPAYRRERWTTPDDDFLDLDFAFDPDRRGDGRPLVLVLHGLEGCSDSGYVRTCCLRLLERELRPVALNFRSCSGEPNRRPRFYHSGETGDPAWVLSRLRQRWPSAPLGAVGFSLGGNALLKLLGERGPGAADLLDAAVAVSVPYRLAAGAGALEEGMGWLYTAYFLRSLRRSVRAKVRRRGHDFDLERLARTGTLRAFDDAFTAPVHGFEDAADYYRRSSAARWLEGIRVPTLVLQSRDDPFLPADALPEAELRRQPWVVAAVQDRGGHVGFVEGSAPWRADFWAEREAARFLRRTLTGTAVGPPGPDG